MDNITLIGIDIAKSVFQMAGLTKHGKKVMNKRVARDKLMETVAQFSSSTTIVMEACGSAHYWA